MDTALQEIMVKTAEYIERTQPLLDRANEQRDSFVKKAAQAAKTLAQRGVIDSKLVDEFVKKASEDPASVWAFVEKLAAAVSVDTMGQAVQTKTASSSDCPFERRFFGVGEQQSGMVETE